MWLPWQYGLWIAAVSAVTAAGLYVRTPPRRWLWLRELAGESAIFATLYAVWQGVGRLPGSNDVTGATARGRAIAGVERALHLPSEGWTQHFALHGSLIVKAANWYYVLGHTPVLAVFLLWLYVRHRRQFAPWRTALAIGCIVGELIQIIPVAPPRLALHGIIDTGRVYGPTVYEAGGEGFAPQLAAMPSLHCVWAITIGAGVFAVARGRWRWLGPVHAVLTVLVVVVTGNHYWLDALAGAALVAVGLAVHRACAYALRRLIRARPAEAPVGSARLADDSPLAAMAAWGSSGPAEPPECSEHARLVRD